MNPRYIVHRDGFSSPTLYIKIEDDKYKVYGKDGEIAIIKSKSEHKKDIEYAESFVKSGIWREVKAEELVLMI